MDQSYWRRNNAFRGAVMEVVEKNCHTLYIPMKRKTMAPLSRSRRIVDLVFIVLLGFVVGAIAVALIQFML
jgi:hypothetical protein